MAAAVSFEELERRIAEWAAADPNVRAAVVLGSRARSEVPADEWSDLDVVLAAREPNRLLDDGGWVAALGPVLMTFVERTAVGGERERRVLYEGGADVDFSVIADERLRALVDSRGQAVPEAVDVIRRGYRVILDKDGLLDGLAAVTAAWQPAGRPSESAFDELVADVWYHAVWAARRLRRGELFRARGAVDDYMKERLVRLLAWQAVAQDPSVDTWFGGRFIERWADPEVLDQLREAFGGYSDEEVARSLRATMALFARAGRETAALLGHAYPEEYERAATALVDELLPDSRSSHSS